MGWFEELEMEDKKKQEYRQAYRARIAAAREKHANLEADGFVPYTYTWSLNVKLRTIILVPMVIARRNGMVAGKGFIDPCRMRIIRGDDYSCRNINTASSRLKLFRKGQWNNR